MASTPDALASVAGLLRCPNCGEPLAATGNGTLRCATGHSFDVARDGHVTLADPRRRPALGDDAAMVAARVAVLGAGHFAPLTQALAAVVPSNAAVVVDVGGGTGHHVAAVLDALPGARGIVLDSSRPALGRAARGHSRIAAIACDVWHHIPLQDGTVDVALNVFAPRNPQELARVVRPGGTLIVVTPAQEHLRELAALHGIRVDPRKDERLQGQLQRFFTLTEKRRIEWSLELTREEALAMVRMGPAAHHMTDAIEQRLHALSTTAVVDVHIISNLSASA